ncbi:hypothetical protein SESBI_36899 [Sesbania bispinosa]|nr:hypothetical protein SESBI_36899 [Sesbania bispinosa]
MAQNEAQVDEPFLGGPIEDMEICNRRPPDIDQEGITNAELHGSRVNDIVNDCMLGDMAMNEEEVVPSSLEATSL